MAHAVYAAKVLDGRTPVHLTLSSCRAGHAACSVDDRGRLAPLPRGGRGGGVRAILSFFFLPFSQTPTLRYFYLLFTRKYEDPDDCIVWWNDRKEIRDGENFKAQKFTADYLLNEQGCNIDLCGYPHEEEEVLDPLDTIREYQERRTTLNAEIDKVLVELEALLPGGVTE